MSAYYNEFDPELAAWLKQLIKNGDIANGEVDERNIADVEAADLRGFTQHHFFAGIGTWSLALRNAGWSDNRPVCTASLPCQPFSTAGKQEGLQDPRHLLPHFMEIVRQCHFHTVVGEQVSTAIKYGWLDDLYDEMERENYTVGAVVLTAAGAGKAHIRQRLYWAAKSVNSTDSWMAHAASHGSSYGQREGGDDQANDQQPARQNISSESKRASTPAPLSEEPIEWILWPDGKHRPVKSGITPLVDGAASGVVYRGGSIDPNNTALARSMRIKGYGNAIVEPLATKFISAIMDL